MTKQSKLYLEFQNKIRTLRDETGLAPECADNYDVFYPEEFHDNETKHQAVRVAKAICNRCPLLADCALYAIEAKEQFGIWGSQTPAERLAFIQNIKRIERRRGSTSRS